MRKSWIGLAFLQIFFLSCKAPSSVELTELFHFRAHGWAHSLALNGTRVYLAERQQGFALYDSTHGFEETLHTLPIRDVISLSADSEMAVLAASYDGLLLISPDGRIRDRYSNGSIMNAVQARGPLAFAAGGASGLVVTRLAGGRLHFIANLPTSGWSHDIRLSRDQALLADWDYGLRIVDIRNPAKPAEISHLPSPATCISLAVRELNGERLLALAEGHAGIALARLDSAGHPILLGRNSLGLKPGDPVHPRKGGWVHGIAWANRYLFAANWKRGMAVLDASDVQNPKLVMQIPTSGTSLGVQTQRQADGSYLVFLADGESGLRIFRFRF